MMDPERFEQVVDELVRRGYPRNEAESLAAHLGDVFDIDQDGKWVIYDVTGTNVIARIDPI